MKKLVLFSLILALLLIVGSACADTGVAYGVYHMEGESPDSLIRATVDVTDSTINSVTFDEKLLPVSFGGAEGWAELPADIEVSGSVTANGKTFPPAFELDGETWTISEDLTVSNTEKGEFIAYITTDEGGKWYFAETSADLLDSEGNIVVSAQIGTKASIEHGVHFWVSDILFPGNIQAIETFITENGVEYSEEQFAKNEDGFWMVADVVSGATLAGTPNYLLLAQEAYAKAVQNEQN